MKLVNKRKRANLSRLSEIEMSLASLPNNDEKTPIDLIMSMLEYSVSLCNERLDILKEMRGKVNYPIWLN